MNSFEELLKSDYSIADDIARCQGVLEHALSKVDFSVGAGIYMLPSNMNLNINNTQGFNNNILISESSYKLGLNNKVNAKQKTVIKTTSRLEIMGGFQNPSLGKRKNPHDNTPKKLQPHEKISVQNHNDGKIVISILMTGTALVIYYFR